MHPAIDKIRKELAAYPKDEETEAAYQLLSNAILHQDLLTELLPQDNEWYRILSVRENLMFMYDLKLTETLTSKQEHLFMTYKKAQSDLVGIMRQDSWWQGCVTALLMTEQALAEEA